MILEVLQDIDRELLLAVNGSDSLYLDRVVRTLTNGLAWIPLYLSMFYLVVKNNDNFRRLLFLLGGVAVCYLLAGAVDDGIVKPLVARWRPTHDPQIGALVDVVDGYRGGKYGFFSAHACNTMSIATYFCWIARSRRLSITLVIWSLVNCWTRLYLGVHFPSDVVVGLFEGALASFIVYLAYWKIYFKISPRLNYISTQYTSTGYSRVDIDVVMQLLVLTVAVAVIIAMANVFA